MKLSEIKGDQALDVLADLIDPVVEIATDEEIQKLRDTGAPILKYVKPIIKNHKKAVTTILALLDGEDPDTYVVTLTSLPSKVLEVMNDTEFINLFKSQSQTTEEASSGSATENTEAEEK